MLVKIDNDSKQFEQAIKIAKKHFKQKTSAGAAKNVILEYPKMIEQQHQDMRKINKLERVVELQKIELEEIKNALKVINKFT